MSLYEILLHEQGYDKMVELKGKEFTDLLVEKWNNTCKKVHTEMLLNNQQKCINLYNKK